MLSNIETKIELDGYDSDDVILINKEYGYLNRLRRLLDYYRGRVKTPFIPYEYYDLLDKQARWYYNENHDMVNKPSRETNKLLAKQFGASYFKNMKPKKS